MQSWIGGQLGVKTAGNTAILLNSDRLSVFASENIDIVTDFGETGCSNENPFTAPGAWPRFPFHFADKRVNLTTVGVAIHFDVYQLEAGGELIRILAHENRTAAGPHQCEGSRSHTIRNQLIETV